MASSYGQAREIMAGLYPGVCTTSPEGYENDQYWYVPVGTPPDAGLDDDCARLISKDTGEITPVHTSPFDDEGRSNIAWLNAMIPVYDNTADPEYLALLKRYRAEYGEGYFDDNNVYGLTEAQIKADIATSLED